MWLEREVLIESSKAEANKVTNLKGDEEKWPITKTASIVTWQGWAGVAEKTLRSFLLTAERD